jgi:hypothetical protein
MRTTFSFDPVVSADALERMARAPDGTVAIDGTQWAQGAMGALMRAEFLAASAGVVPWITLDDGTRAIINVGAARDVIDKAPEGVRTLYLATHGLVRQTHARAFVWDGQTPMLQAADDELGALPVVAVVVIVLGVAAILATAAYFIHKDTIEVDGRNLRTTSILSGTLDLARTQYEATGKIDPGLYGVLQQLAANEAQDSSAGSWKLWALGGGLAAAAVAGAWAWFTWGGVATKALRAAKREEAPS